MKKRLLLIPLALLLVVSMVAIACEEEETTTPTTPTSPTTPVVTKDEIIFGGARPLTGANAIYEQVAYGPIYRMWIADVNADGGLYIADYGKKLPIVYEDYIYDDNSDISTMTRQLEKLMTVDKVDFCLAPASTAFLFASAPIFNKYEYILLGAEGGATTITDQLPGLPYFFGVLNYSDRYQVPVFADLCVELGIEKVGMVWLQDLHGIEYSGVAGTEFEKAGIEIVMSKSVPPDIQDTSLLLLEAQDAGVEALCVFTYDVQNFLLVGQAIELGINFDAILLGPGGCFSVFPDVFGPAVEGVMFEGAWNCESTPGAAALCDRLTEEVGFIDWWGHLHYQGAIEFFEQAIVEAGTLDQQVIREIMATSTFDTILGPTWFDQFGEDGGCLLAIECQPGEIGQWQNGYPEIVDPPNQYGEKRTAEPWYPKPDWPTGG